MSTGIHAQKDTIFTMARFDQHSLKIRWSSDNIDLLRSGINRGWKVRIFQEGEPEPVRSLLIQRDDDRVMHTLRNSGDSSVLAIFEEIGSGATFFSEEEQLEWYRFAFLFGLQDNFALSQSLGMALEIKGLDIDSKYEIKVEINGVGDFLSLPFTVIYQDTVILEPAEAPNFVCNNNRISMTGFMTFSANSYSSYYLEKREYPSTSFVQINELPLVVNYAYGDPMINFIDSISKTGYTEYRVRGKDMWGVYGPYSDTVRVDPCHIRYMPPHPFYIREIEDQGGLQLQWNIADSIRHLLQGFNIYRANQKFGDYLLLNDAALPADVFEFIDTSPLHVGYYQVHALYQGGVEKNSLSVLGTIWDLVPPAIPGNVKALLDSATMIVTVTWDPVDDQDLKGYRLSFSHEIDGPKFLLNNLEIDQTIFFDTLAAGSLHRQVFYWVTSRDFNQNESFYSESAVVVMPDIFPPASPRITELQPDYAWIKIYFDGSPSEDVQTHILQKRIKTKSTSDSGWENISLASEHIYIDSSIAIYDTAEYRILAMDQHGLTSLSNTRLGYLLDPVMLPGFDYLKAELQDSLVAIYFDYSDKYQPVKFRLMAGTSELEMQTIALMDAADVVIQPGIKKGGSNDTYTLYRYHHKLNDRSKNYYKLKAINARGKVSSYSQAFTY